MVNILDNIKRVPDAFSTMVSGARAYDASRDPYKTWNGLHFVFTLNKIAAISGGLFEVPEAFKDIADKPIDVLDYDGLSRAQPAEKLYVLFITAYYNSRAKLYAQYAQEGVVVFTHVRHFDENGVEVPEIRLKNVHEVRKVWLALGEYVRRVFPTPTIAITGSIGKTTTTLFMESLFSQAGKTFTSGRNRNNSAPIVQQLVRRWGPQWDYHVQEVGGGGPTVVERSAAILHPNAFCIGNIYPHHLDKYETIDGIVYDKTSLDRLAADDAFGVINLDDEVLANHEFEHRIVTFAVNREDADYRATNIRQAGKWLTMDIVVAATGEFVPIKINIPGIHNAYNAACAFAMAREWGLTNEQIQAGFLAYKSKAIRQCLREVSGRLLYIDCFNVSADSIRSCMKTLESFECEEGARKIAFINGENALGDKAFSVNYGVGLEMADYDIDEYVFVGPSADAPEEEFNNYGHGRAVYEGAKRVLRGRKPAWFFDDLGKAADWLVANSKPGDVVLFKGIFRLPLFAIIDRAFGTAYTVYDPNFPGQNFGGQGFWVNTIPEIGAGNIYQWVRKEPELRIPDCLNEKPVYRIGKQVAAGRTDLEKVDFGLSLMAIGEQCFEGCSGLTELDIPANVIHVESKAFANCGSLERVKFIGVEHIEQEAFKGCKKLTRVELPATCATIEEGVFDGCPKLVIATPEGSYAWNYARENGIPVEKLVK